MITYDPNGFYGHPDHIQAHRVAMRAAELAARRGLRSREDLLDGDAAQRARGRHGRVRRVDRTTRSRASRTSTTSRSARPTQEIAARIDATDLHDAKDRRDAGARHPDPGNSWLYAIAGNFGSEFMGVEYYTLAYGEKGSGNGWESDLFAGLPASALATAPS